MFFAKFNKSCLITYLGIIFGVLAMYFCFANIAFSDVEFFSIAMSCFVVSGVCDMFDGKFARSCKRTEEEKEFGVQLDSLADTFCFLAVPVVYMLCLGMTKPYFIIIYALFIICGVSRLGYFNIKADCDNAVKTYQGLPVTSTSIIFPILSLIHPLVSHCVFATINIIVLLITSILMVVNIKIPKFKGSAYIIVPILALILVILIMVF